jgi:hypothetical protein
MDQDPDGTPVVARPNATTVPTASAHVKRRTYLKRGMRRGGGSVIICAPIRAFPTSKGAALPPFPLGRACDGCVALSRVCASTTVASYPVQGGARAWRLLMKELARGSVMNIEPTRRTFLWLALGAAAYPLTVVSQEASRTKRLGVLMGYRENDREARARLVAFFHSLEELGWREGRNLRLEYRWAAANPDQIRSSALIGPR